MKIRKLAILPVFLTLWVFAIDASVAQENNYSHSLLPMPEALRPNVEFWKNVYAKYSERDVVIHDSEDLHIVYEVVNLDELFHGLNISSRLQWKKINNIKKEYQAILLGLARRPNLKLQALSGKDSVVAALFGNDLNARRLRRASGHIRAQSGLKERFALGLKRSTLYLPKMREIFLKEELPLELLVLPHVESSFNYRAYSKFGAAGIWQFTRSTGRYYMTINYEVDERLDPILATEAAAKHLKRNHQKLGSWPLAITAYNHGLNGMLKARNRHGSDIARIVQHYRSRSFGFASRNFYAEFLAALYVANNYKHYFGDLEFWQSREYVTFRTPDYISVKTLVDMLEIDVEEFSEFNPALRTPVLESRRRIPRNFEIRIPMKPGLNVVDLYAKISPAEKYSEQVRPEWHKVRTGENLSSIARRYDVSVRELLALNNIRNPHRIYAGQNLQIPSDARPPVARTTPTVATVATPHLAEATDLTENTGETVTDVPSPVPTEYALSSANDADLDDEPATLPETEAQPPADQPTKENLKPIDLTRSGSQPESNAGASFQIDPSVIQRDMALALPNHYVELTRSMDVRVVRIPHVEQLVETFRELDFPQNGQVVVEPDETVGHFADWLGVTASRIRSINGLAYGQPIRVGQPIWLTFERVTPEEFHRRRIEFHQGIEEDFYRNFSIEGEQLYRVQRGDNIWIICNRRFEIPYWLIQKYNPNKDLTQLIAGEEIAVPIVEEKLPYGVLEND